MADDLTLRALIEAVLDAKGFDEFRARVQSAGEEAARGSTRTSGLGEAADRSGVKLKRLGENIPAAGVAIFTQNLIRATGSMAGTERAVSVFSQGLGALALSIPNVGLALGGLLGVAGLAVGAISSKREETDKDVDASNRAADANRDLAVRLRDVDEAYGNLTPALLELLRVKRELARQNQLETITGLIAERTALDQNVRAIQDRIRIVEGNLAIERASAEVQAATRARIAELNAELDKLRARQADVAAQIAAETEARRAGTLGIEDQIDAIRRRGEAEERAARESRQRAEDERRRQMQLEVERIRFSARQQRDAREAERDEARAQRQRLLIAQDELVTILDNKREQDAADQEFKDAERQRTEEGIQQTFALLAAAFPKNKGLAIADAMINTFVGATRAIRDFPPPLGFALAAAIIAFGLAQVANIRKQEAAGFDVPQSDLLARTFGEKWAADLIANVDAGFMRAVEHLRTPGVGAVTSITRNTTINSGQRIGNVSLGGFFGTNRRELLKKLNRELITIQRMEDRTRL